jgi:uncharacterized membrane protein
MTASMSRLGWAVMAVLAVGVGAYAIAILAVPMIGAPLLGGRFASMPLAAYGHIGGGAVAMMIGAFQVNETIREAWLARHRWLGRLYVAAVLVAAPSGLAMATVSEGGSTAHLGFGALAIVWFFATAMAYLQIRARNIAVHKQWMIRSYALTLAAVTLRIYLPGALMSGVPFEAAYPAISWLCWVPNLIVAEWLIRRASHQVPA